MHIVLTALGIAIAVLLFAGLEALLEAEIVADFLNEKSYEEEDIQ